MINKTINNEKAVIIRDIALKYGLTDLSDNFNEFIIKNTNYIAHILMIGGYSAGKSALLNRYIGKCVLKENQGPETDIATELHFSEKERIVANLLNGTKKDISSIEELNIEETYNIEYYLNSENIKTQCDYIIVDTPGFDSGIEKHNKALMQYIDYGTAFILVIDCEKGTISESTLKFVNEVTSYSADIAIIINKCDKKIEEDVQEIKQHIEDLLFASTGRTFPIICTSIFDKDIEKKLKGFIARFDSQHLYDKNITSELNRRANMVIQALEIIKKNAICDTSEIEEEISKREEARKKLFEKIDLQKKKLGTKLHNEVKEKIISNIHSQLIYNVEMLVTAYKSGVEMFQEKVIEIIRPIMISEIENYSSVAYENFIKNLNYGELNTLNSTDDIEEVIKSVYNKLIELNNIEGLTVPIVHKPANGELANSGLKVYKTVSSILAIATNAIAPALELLIIFLPDAIKFLTTLIGNSKEKQLIEIMQNKIIPQIITKITNELNKSLNEVEFVMVDNILSNVKEILDVENNALNIAKNKKKETEETYINYIANIDSDIITIRKQVAE